MMLVLLALLAAAPRVARVKGDSPRLAKAKVEILAPADLARIEFDVPLQVQLRIANYSLADGSHAHLIVDNEPAMQIDDPSKPVELKLEAGPHLLRAVLCRPWHEVVKAPHAFAMARFWVGPPLPGKAGKAAEYVAWPDPKKPVLTYVLPLPQGRPVLDFYLASGKLARRGDKVRVVLDRRELPLLTEWKPVPLRRARSGQHKITIDLLNRKGLKVKNAVNRTDRVFSVTR